MGDSFVPNDILISNIYDTLEFDNRSLVQFYHRNLAYLIVIYVLFLTFLIYTKKNYKLYNSLKILIFILVLQISIGIFTLISELNIYLASAHQILGVLLVLSVINLYYFNAK